jgi:DNA-binding transcriptional LysR family regulator
MELRHLRYFVAVAETLNFSQAARQLHLAQPPLSAQVRSLEAELGVQLFERTSRGVALTKAGRALLPAARDTLAAAERAREAARVIASGKSGLLRLGLISPAATPELAARLKKFHRAHPLVQLRVRQDDAATLQRLLDADQIDLAITRPLSAHPRLRHLKLGEQEQGLALPADHPWTKRRSIPMRQLHCAPLLLINPESNPNYGQLLLGHCARLNVQPAINYAADDLATLVWLVSAGLGVCPYPLSLVSGAPRGVVFRPFSPRLRQLELVAIWPTQNQSSTLEAFVAALQS